MDTNKCHTPSHLPKKQFKGALSLALCWLICGRQLAAGRQAASSLVTCCCCCCFCVCPAARCSRLCLHSRQRQCCALCFLLAAAAASATGCWSTCGCLIVAATAVSDYSSSLSLSLALLLCRPALCALVKCQFDAAFLVVPAAFSCLMLALAPAISVAFCTPS